MPIKIGMAAAGALFIEKQLLIIRRSPSSKIDPHKWEIPKGKVRSSEDQREALKREVLEEIGLDVLIDENPLFSRSFTLLGFQIRLYVYLIHSLKLDPEIQLSHEHVDHTWITDDEISEFDFATGIEGVVRRLFRDYLPS
ncbi:MAG: NUDIX domain-containing protein [Promethearchaeota archaeon]